MLQFWNYFKGVMKLLPYKYRLYYCIYTIFSIIADSLVFLLPLLYARILDNLTNKVFEKSLLIVYVVIIIISDLIFKGWSMMNIINMTKVKCIIGDKIFANVIKKQRSEFTSLITINLDGIIEMFLDYIYTIPSSIVSFLITMIIVIKYSPKIFFIHIIWGVLFIFLTKKKNKDTIPLLDDTQGSFERINTEYLSTLHGIDDILISNSKQWAVNRQKNFFNKYECVAKSYYRMLYLYDTAIEIVNKVFYIGCISVSVYTFFKGEMSLGLCVALNGYILNSYDFLKGFVSNLQYINSFIPHMKAILDIFSNTEEINNLTLDKDVEIGEISFEKISIRRDEFEIRDFSFEVRRGEILAINGNSGCGKSSLVSALANLIKLEEGNIHINGRTKIVIAEQNPFIYNRTIVDNVFLCRSGIDTLEELLRIFDLPISYFVDNNGKLKNIGQDGELISGGQRSKIGLIRALLNDGDIYVLDEPLVGVDENTKNNIMKYLVKNIDSTIVIISHDPVILKYATRIVNME